MRRFARRRVMVDLSFADLSRLLDDPFAREELSGQCVVVHGPQGATQIDLGGTPAVFIHRSDRFDRDSPLDVMLTDDDIGAAATAAIAANVTRYPQAAVTAVLLLRGADNRTISDGLIAESTAYSVLQSGHEFAAWRAGAAPRITDDAAGCVRMERVANRLEITLQRPHRHNAFNTAMRNELCEALSLVCCDTSIERVTLRGAGPSFCSGGDLAEFGRRPDPATAHLTRLTRSPAALLAALAERVEVRVHGACLGAGIELAAFAHRVRAHPGTRFGLPELTLGLIPGAGGTVSIPRRIGRHRTAQLALLATTVDAATALAWGLIDEIDEIDER